MAQLITLKNAIKKGLRKRGLEVIHQLDEASGDDGSDDIVRISKYMFDENVLADGAALQAGSALEYIHSQLRQQQAAAVVT